MRHVSHDLTLREALPLADGSTITALEVQWELFDLARRYVDDRGTDNVGGETAHEVLRRWELVLAGLERDPMELADQLDWVAKYRLLDAYRERNDLAWSDARLRAMDMQYPTCGPDKGLAWRVGLEQFVNDADAAAAIDAPPAETRAYFRGRCVAAFPDDVVAANWDSIVFDIGTDALRRVPMMEPMRGTQAHVGTLFDECETAAELLRRLEADHRDGRLPWPNVSRSESPPLSEQESETAEAPASSERGRGAQGRHRRPARRDRRSARDQRRGLREELHPEGRAVALLR